MEGILELQRRTHEIVDHLEEAVTQAMIQKPRTQKGRLMQEHYVSSLLDQIVESSHRLEVLYADADGRQADMSRITPPEDDTFGSFYDHLKIIKDRHRRLESTIEDLVEAEAIKSSARLSDDQLSKRFSGEESLGRFLDLLEPYDLYINLKEVRKIEYLRYLDHVDSFDQVPVSAKSTPAYKAYLTALCSYLVDFTKRTRPLLDSETILKGAHNEFCQRWSQAAVPGWEELAKNECDDLYCEACQKQFYNASVFKAHLPGKKHQKAASELEKGNGIKVVSLESEGRWAKDVASIEATISHFLSLLSKEREETKNHIEAKQSRSSAERALDVEREEAEIEESKGKMEEAQEEDEERDPKIYNPLNLPLDWDGKPIPYWLWKLHGLGTRYPCEICGNQVYMGRKAFDQHFYEWRHSQGLRCLGIPNTRHFFQVTSIQDAQTLWEKLKKDARQANFRPEVMEEVEDQHGNVYSRKTYEDLKRQGLI